MRHACHRWGLLAVGALALCAPRLASAQSPDSTAPSDEQDGDEIIIIEGEAPYVPVASRTVRDRDLALRPRPRPADVLRAVPGMFVNQHAGGGKANQYFLRGFDADHGTDVALSVDGIPANMVSHGHGQGYADLNWVIPELIAYADIFKGPYSAAHGDFATAGAVDLVTHERLEQSSLSSTAGSFDTYRLLAVTSPGIDGGWSALLAAESYFTNGPFDHGEEYLRYNAFAKVGGPLGERSSLQLALTSYAGGWDASGQIPLREVRAGRLGRFDAIDPTDGGHAARHSLYGIYRMYPDEDSEVRVLGYAVRGRLALYSNFTFFSGNPTLGDQIEQTDDRTTAGFASRYRFRRRWRGLRFDTTIGASARSDGIDNALYRTAARERLSADVDARVAQTSLGVWGQEDVRWTRWLRSVVGARLDFYGFAVTDRLDDPAVGITGTGVRERALVSPKASLVASPARHTDVYANAGFGFHSNDARGAVSRPDRATPLARARGYELGARSRIGGSVDVAGSLWLLDLDSEIVWVGDEGVTEPRGRTRRIGAELEVRAALVRWLVADLDATASRARFRDAPDGANLVPLAPRYTVTAGLSARHPRGLFGRIGARSLSDRPLTEDGFLVAGGFTLVDVTAGYRTDRYEVMLAVDNLFDTQWAEAQFATTSRVPGDPPADQPAPDGACPERTRVEQDAAGNFAGCEDVHFTPGAPLNAMLTLRLLF